jgi:hypothetical protein
MADVALQNKAPVERRDDGTLAPGSTANPGGRPKKLRALEAAILEAETPERVKEVVNAMRAMALSGDAKGAPAAAKVYFQVIGINTKVEADFANILREAPPEVRAWLSAALN